MAAPATTHVQSYLRQHPIPGFSDAAQIQPLPGAADEQRFLLTEGDGAAIFKRYASSAMERARREAAGLQLGGQVGLATALLLFDEAGGALGGPVVAFAAPPGDPIGGRPISGDEAQGWLFLLLTLHHLPPDGVRVTSTLSPDLTTWWQRVQPTYQACRKAYEGRATRSLLDALNKLHAIVGARVEARSSLWRTAVRRPCHGNAVPAHVVSDGGRLALVEWGDFGLADPAMEIGRAAGLALLSGELTSEQHAQLVGGYLRGTSDFGDASLSDRLVVYGSVLPMGFALTLLQLLAQPGAPREGRARELDQIAAALGSVAQALGVKIGDPRALLAPLG